MSKRLDQKLASIRNGQYTPKDFIIADAKDADMANGCKTAGLQRVRVAGTTQSRFTEMICKIMDSDLVDIMLTSLSSAEVLTQQGPANTEITPAVRLNDTTDIWVGRGAAHESQPALPFRTARLDRVKPVSDLGFMQSPSTTICIRIIALWRSTPVLGTKHRPKVLDIF